MKRIYMTCPTIKSVGKLSTDAQPKWHVTWLMSELYLDFHCLTYDVADFLFFEKADEFSHGSYKFSFLALLVYLLKSCFFYNETEDFVHFLLK